MIWKIAKKEFLLNLMTFKFALATVVCVVLTAVFVPILAKDYQQRLKTYNDNVARNEAELRKVRVYKNITPTIFRPPAILSVFSAGLEKQLVDSAKIDMESVSGSDATFTEDNPYLSIFTFLDASLILKIVISLLAILLAYDAVSGEKQRGTLRLILANRTARHEVLLGKLLAGLMVLVVLVTITFILGLVILLSFPMVDLAGADWARVGLMYLASLIFISVMYNIGLLFSCLATRPAISLILGLFFWVVCVVVIPNGGVYAATRIRPLEHKENTDRQVALLRSEINPEAWRQIRQTVDIQSYQHMSENDLPDAFGHFYVVGCSKDLFECHQKINPITEPLRIKYADKIWELENGYLKTLLKQRRLADNLSRISPIFSYENAMSILAGTGLSSFQSFMSDAKTYRNQMIEYIRSRTDNFSSPSYFTTCTREDVMEYAKDWGGRKARDAENPPPPLNLQDFPLFVHRLDLAESVRRVIPDSALLVFANMVFFALSFVAFIKYDVR